MTLVGSRGKKLKSADGVVRELILGPEIMCVGWFVFIQPFIKAPPLCQECFQACCSSRLEKTYKDPGGTKGSLLWTVVSPPFVFTGLVLFLLRAFHQWLDPPFLQRRGKSAFKVCLREFPGGPVVRTPHFHCQGPGFDPWLGN